MVHLPPWSIRALRADRAATLGRYGEARDGYEAAIRHAQRLGALTEVPTFAVPDARTDRWIWEHATPRGGAHPPGGDVPAGAATRIVERAVALLDAVVAVEPSVSS